MTHPRLKEYREPNKPYTHAVYFDFEGKRRRRKFESERAAKDFLAEKEIELKNLGTAVASEVDTALKLDAHRAKQILQDFPDVTLEAAAKFYRDHLTATQKSGLVEDLVLEFIATKDGRSTRTVEELSQRLGKFADKFRGRQLNTVTVAELDKWLGALNVAGRTMGHYRSKVGSLYVWAVKKGYAEENPVLKTDKATVAPTECGIFTPDDMQVILRAAADYGHKGVLANVLLGGFAGLRAGTIEKLDWEHVREDQIAVPAANMKKRRRHIVAIQPVLADWLKEFFAKGRKGLVIGDNFYSQNRKFRSLLKRKHGITWHDNGLRHSYATYRLEATRNPGEVAMELGHGANPAMLFQHYAERVSSEDAAAYWKLTPAVALEG